MMVSIVIPCYNEGKNIPQLLKRCKDAFSGKDIEVIIVDNGSIDNTHDVLDKLLPEYTFIKRVIVKKNMGYGNGILQGLNNASGEFLGWTHADLQTNPEDINTALDFFQKTDNKETMFVKGKRYGRPFSDVFFTIGMAFFESILMRTWMWDINAQPTLFHKSFYKSWQDAPSDFSLDLYVYFLAKNNKYTVRRFPVLFGKRLHGISSWNISWSNKYKFIKRTLMYSFLLKKNLKNSVKNTTQG